MATSLSSPGVEVREIDASLRVQNNGGTTVFIPGFASQGPVEEITSISSMADFEQIYGVPTNAAERYFYYTVRAVLNNSSSSTTILVSRLPYGEGEGDTVSNAYTLLAYPVVPVHSKTTVTYKTKDDTLGNKKLTTLIDKAEKEYSYNVDTKNKLSFVPNPSVDWGKKWSASVEGGIEDTLIENNITYVIGEPTEFQVSLSEYYDILTDVLFNSGDEPGWSPEAKGIIDDKSTEDKPKSAWYNLRHAGLIVINKSRSIINESLEGHYFALNDNLFNEPSNLRIKTVVSGKDVYTPVEEYNAIKSIKFSNISAKNAQDHMPCTSDNYQNINATHLDFELQGSNQGSISKVLQKDMSTYTTDDMELDDVITCAVFKLNKSTTGTKALKLAYSLKENYNFSLGETRVTSSIKTSVPVTLYGPNVTKNSNNLVMMINPHIAKTIKVDIDGNIIGRVRIASDKLLEKLYAVEQTGWIDEEYEIDPETGLPVIDPETGEKIITVAKNYSNTDIICRAGIDYDHLAALLNEPDACASLGDIKVDWLNKCQSLYSFGTYRLDKAANQYIGSVPSKVTRTLTLIENDEEYPDVDIVCEAGLGTIYTYASVDTDEIISSLDGVIERWKGSSGEYDVDYSAGDKPVDGDERIARNFVDTLVLQGVEDLRTGQSNLNEYATTVKDYYMSVQNVFLGFANTFANGGRGDVFYLPDIIRGIVIKGVDTKIESLYGSRLINDVYEENSEIVNHSWATSAYAPIKHLYDSFTSSFAAVYATMFKIEDTYTNKFVWLPASGYIAAAFAASDTLAGPWLAGAGLNRGIVQGVLDTALNPTLRQRDDLYKISINAVPKLANVGVVIYGIRTMIKKPTSFDQVTCRRTALLLGKTMKKYLKYYVFEPNTSYTRLCIYNDLQPYLESIKAAGGIYNYRLVTDESVNTAEIINNGELAVAATIQYVRTAEFITLTMTAEKYTSTVTVAEA